LAEKGWPSVTKLAFAWLAASVMLSLVFYGILVILSRWIDGNKGENSAVRQIEPFFKLLATEEKKVLRFILPLHRSPTNLNVGQLTALESIQQKTGRRLLKWKPSLKVGS